MQRIKELVFIAIFATGLATGCNVSTTGAEGNIQFTPDDCGRVGGCDFNDSIGVGGVVNVRIQGLDGFSTAGVTLDSDDPGVFTVTAIPDQGGPIWEIYGAGSGVARLTAWDSTDTQVDYIDIGVQELTGLTMENIVGSAVGTPSEDPGYDEVWTVNADERVVLHVTPLIGDGVPTMGRYLYTPFIEDQAFDDYINDYELLDLGQLDFTAPPGFYGISFADDFDNVISILIDVQATPN